MKKTILHISVCILLTAILVLNLAGCGIQAAAADLMEGVSKQTVTGKTTDAAFVSPAAGFAVELFKKTVAKGKNSLISPLSVMLALAMTANGADSQTKAEMQTLLGGDIPLEELNEYLYNYIKNLPSAEKYKLEIANSIWFKNDGTLSVKPEFLQTNANYYDAAARKAPFDKQTAAEINSWVKENTDGMIDQIIEEIPAEALMYLINAVVFDAEWQTVYTQQNVSDGKFHVHDGTEQNVKMMHSMEGRYLDDGKATGFIKNYKDGKYSFAALLPNEGISIDDYIASLTGEGLIATLSGAKDESLTAVLPKFGYDYKITMNDALKALGMPTAFDAQNADFSKLGTSTVGNLYIGEVLHKTHIEVNENGTRAGAVTSVMMCGAGLPNYSVTLDRPFVYVIVDNATNLPIFIGTVLSVG